MTVWQPMATMPADRPVLLVSRTLPVGHRFGDLTIHVGQRGNGTETGIWAGRDFYPDRKCNAYEIPSSVFCGWADVPVYDLEG